MLQRHHMFISAKSALCGVLCLSEWDPFWPRHNPATSTWSLRDPSLSSPSLTYHSSPFPPLPLEPRLSSHSLSLHIFALCPFLCAFYWNWMLFKARLYEHVVCTTHSQNLTWVPLHQIINRLISTWVDYMIFIQLHFEPGSSQLLHFRHNSLFPFLNMELLEHLKCPPVEHRSSCSP